jgi:TrmH family RNA methyltransferase
MLTSARNPLVKQLRQLHRAKGRRELGWFLLEGTHLVTEAIATDFPLAVVCSTPDWQLRYPQLWAQVVQRVPQTMTVNEAVIGAIATTQHPDGVVAAAVRQSPPPPPSAVTLGLALETLQDPGNVGTILRVAAATSVDGLWMDRTSVDLDHPKVLRASAGQWFRLNACVTDDLPTAIAQVQATGVRVVATTPTAPLTHWEADWRSPVLFLLGNEGAGLSPQALALADQQVRVPLAPGVESLNVGITAALLCYEVLRQRAGLSG